MNNDVLDTMSNNDLRLIIKDLYVRVNLLEITIQALYKENPRLREPSTQEVLRINDKADTLFSDGMFFE